MTYRTDEPLYRDPLEDGAGDPTLIWNHHENAWWMIYTSRRVTSAHNNGVGWVHGTGLGVASSTDHGRTWLYRGQIGGLDTEWGTNTFWAPEILEADGTYHMYVSYIQGVPATFREHPRHIRHYTSTDLQNWRYQSDLDLSSDAVIDACVFPLPSGGYRMWYKDEANGDNIWYADSDDLYSWQVAGPAIVEDHHMEGPYVFQLAGSYWMLVDAKRQDVYRSSDLTHWSKVGKYLDSASGSISDRLDDLGPGLHGSVIVAGDTAYVFYFTHPGRNQSPVSDSNHRRSSIHAATMRWEHERLNVVRDRTVHVDLSAGEPKSRVSEVVND